MSRRRTAFLSVATLLLTAQAAVAAISFSSAEPISAAASPEFVAVGDLNRDGRSDVVVVSPSSDEIDIYLGSSVSPSRFASATVVRLHKPGRPALGDLNADNNLDLAVPEEGSRVVWILLGKGDGTFLSPRAVSLADAGIRTPTAVAIGDFDGVRNNDLAVTDRRQGKVFIRLNTGGNPPAFSAGGALEVGPEPVDIRAADFSGDGGLDLATLDFGGPRVKEIAVLLFQRVQAGFPVFASAQKFVAGEKPSSLNVADFDSDGISDIAMVDRPSTAASGTVVFLLSQGEGVFKPPQQMEIPCPFFTGGLSCQTRGIAVGDFDGDRNPDIAVVLKDPRRFSSTIDAMQIFAGQGDGSFAPGSVLTVGKSPTVVATGDFDGDQRVDIVVATKRVLAIQAFINISTPGEKSNGDLCVMGDECLSGRCTNGRCCATACADVERCDVPSFEGTCMPVPVEPVECEVDLDCERGEACVDGFCCDAGCNPRENRCDVSGFEGICIPKSENGVECSEAAACLSGFCRDDVCCNQDCQEGACDIEGHEGECQPRLPLGELCSTDEECGSNVCDVFDGICCVRRCDAATEDCSDDGTQCLPLEFTPGKTGAPAETPTRTPSQTATPTPLPDGTDCDDASQCESGNCVNNVCCVEPQCGEDEHCAMGSGECVPGTAPPRATPTPTPTRTVTPTRTATGIATFTPIGGPCGGECAPENCVNGFCVFTSRGGGCTTAGDGGDNVAMAALVPVVLWLGRRWQRRHAGARASSKA